MGLVEMEPLGLSYSPVEWLAARTLLSMVLKIYCHTNSHTSTLNTVECLIGA